MKTSNMIYLGLGVGAVAATALLFTTAKGKKIRGSIQDNANLWTKKLSSFASDAGDELNRLTKLVENQATDLSDDAREKIMNILKESSTSGKKVKKSFANHLANGAE